MQTSGMLCFIREWYSSRLGGVTDRLDHQGPGAGAPRIVVKGTFLHDFCMPQTPYLRSFRYRKLAHLQTLVNPDSGSHDRAGVAEDTE
jgi:hypothetical protein